jgi:hypothetical protein
MEIKITNTDRSFGNAIIFDNLRTYQCPCCGSITYFYDDNRLVFVTTHRNTFLHEDRFFFVPRCQRCDTEFAHMIKAVEIMKRSGD